MNRYENLTAVDKCAYLAELGIDIFAERRRLAIELRALLNERRLTRSKLKTFETPKQKV